MHFLPVLFGYATTVIPRVYTYYVSTALFAIFGIRMLREGLKMSPDEGQEELEEVQAELKKKDEEVSHGSVRSRDQRSTQLRASTPELVGGAPSLCHRCGLHKRSLCRVCLLELPVMGPGVRWPGGRDAGLMLTFGDQAPQSGIRSSRKVGTIVYI